MSRYPAGHPLAPAPQEEEEREKGYVAAAHGLAQQAEQARVRMLNNRNEENVRELNRLEAISDNFFPFG